MSDVTRLYFGNGALPSTGAAPDVAVADFNRDGKPDLFVAESGFDAFPFPGALNVLLESTTNGPYVNLTSTLPAIFTGTYSATTADVNGDGILDIYVGVLGNSKPQEKPYLLIGKTDGSFDRVSSTLPTWLADDVKWENSFTSSLLVDVDNDGYPDLVLGRWLGGLTQSESLILLNDGRGDFTQRAPVFLPSGAYGSNTTTLNMATIDANGDGYPDLLLVNVNHQENSGGQIQLLINRGDGTFVDETLARLGPRATLLTGNGWGGVSVVDINGDGKPDIAALSGYCCRGIATGSPTDFAWINDGHGAFAPVAVSALSSPQLQGSIALIDANGDGTPDLVAWYYKFDTGELVYQTYFNTAARSVPSEPLIINAAAGSGQATVAFKAPIAQGATPITSYTATCRFGALAGVATGAASPLTVTGLTNGKPHLCSVTATSASGTSLPSATLPVTPTPNYQGIWWNAPAESESGWGINFAHQGDFIFAAWYTYDGNGRAWWLTMLAEKTGPNTYAGKLKENRGPALNAQPFNKDLVQQFEVGDGTLTFTDGEHGTFRYTVNGTTQTKSLARFVFGPMPTCTWGAQANLALATNYQDMWWNAPAESESGWGVTLTHQGDIIFVAWFTYDLDGKPLWLTATVRKGAPGVYSGEINRTTGPAFSATPWSTVTPSKVGDLTITFANGKHASFHYTLNLGGVAIDQTKTIERFVFQAPGTVCN